MSEIFETIQIMRKNLGPVTAYKYAVQQGYTGTEQEFAALMASYATVAEEAEAAKDDAIDAKTAAEAAQAAAEAAAEQAEGAIEVDDTLSVKGRAADAKAVGDAIGTLKSNATVGTITSGYYINGNGGETTDENYAVCDYIDVEAFVAVLFSTSLLSSRGLAFYDTTKTCLLAVNGNNCSEYGYTANSKPQTVMFNVPTGTKYLRFTRRIAYGITVDDFAVVGYSYGGLVQDVKDIKKEIAEIDLDNFIKKVIIRGKNLYNPQKATTGLIQQNGTVDNNSLSYVTSDYIPVTSGQSVTTYARIRRFLAFDAEKNPIAASYVADANNSSYTYTATQDGYIRASFYASATVFQIEYGITATTPQEYTETTRIENGIYPSETISRNVGNVLYGKKWVAVGDSFTEGLDAALLTDGKYKGEHGCYPYLIGNNTGINVVKFFRGGRTMAYPSDGSFTNSFCCPTDPWYYQNIPEDTDYLTIKLGINDVNHSSGSGTTPDGEDATGVITLGTIDDTDPSTYYGAWNTVMTWLLNNRPFVHIGIIVTNGTQSEGFTNAQINIAKKYGVPYLNENGDQRTRAMLRSYNPDIPANIKELIKQKQSVDYDGSISGSVNWHPNTYAHKLESTFIENFLRTL